MINRADYAKASPEGYKAFGGVYLTLQKSSLPRQLVDLVHLRVSQINGCAYCIDMHSRDLLKDRLPVDKLALVSVWPEGVSMWPQVPSHSEAGVSGSSRTERWKQQLLSGYRVGSDKKAVREPAPVLSEMDALLQDERTEYDRDYDRIVFSAEFRCLHDKTQVFPLSTSDYTRTRLTHSIEASCVGRSLGALAGRGLRAREIGRAHV